MSTALPGRLALAPPAPPSSSSSSFGWSAGAPAAIKKPPSAKTALGTLVNRQDIGTWQVSSSYAGTAQYAASSAPACPVIVFNANS
jgi:hypothetical protein